MLQFKEIELSDKEWMEPLFRISDYRGCEYCFTNCFVWRNIFDITAARFHNFCILKHGDSFVFPAGCGDTDALISQLLEYCNSKNMPLRFCSMDKSAKQILEEKYPGKFRFDTDEGLYDYVYETQSLSTLTGKKLHSKRNYINRFKQLNWSFEEITPDNIKECEEMSYEWCKLNNCDENEEKSEEMCAVATGLKYFFELGLVGGILRVDGKVQAFSYGSSLNSDTFDTHVEKAFTEYDGTYPMINYLMANRFCKNFKYINREEDMGEENLRKAKRSYRPCFMVEKFSAVYIG